MDRKRKHHKWRMIEHYLYYLPSRKTFPISPLLPFSAVRTVPSRDAARIPRPSRAISLSLMLPALTQELLLTDFSLRCAANICIAAASRGRAAIAAAVSASASAPSLGPHTPLPLRILRSARSARPRKRSGARSGRRRSRRRRLHERRSGSRRRTWRRRTCWTASIAIYAFPGDLSPLTCVLTGLYFCRDLSPTTCVLTGRELQRLLAKNRRELGGIRSKPTVTAYTLLSLLLTATTNMPPNT